MLSPGVSTIPLLSALLCLASRGVGAKPAVGEENLKDILSIPGMTQAKDGTLLFKNQKVKNITSVGGGQDFQLPKPYKEEDDDDVMKKETDVGWDPSNEVKTITPIKSMTELKSVQEITKMTPVKSIEEIISMKEIKSIEEIKEKIAREFIRKHGLQNLIVGGSGSLMEGENGPRHFGDTKLESMEDNPRAFDKLLSREDTDDNFGFSQISAH